MPRKNLLVFILSFFFTNLFANFEEGKKLFEQKCSSCHKEYISFEKLKENFFERNNKLLNINTPTENMLAWAIMESSKKIGDPNDTEMRAIEIEEYLKDYLANPNLDESICDRAVLKYYVKKEPMKITDEEAELLASYFIGYKENRLKSIPKTKKTLEKNIDEEALIKSAKKNGKHIIVYATSQTCYYCKKMQKEVLSLKEVQNKMGEDYLFVKVDVDFVTLPFNLKKKFKGMTPTFFILTSDAQILNIYPGSWVKDDFLKILEENL